MCLFTQGRITLSGAARCASGRVREDLASSFPGLNHDQEELPVAGGEGGGVDVLGCNIFHCVAVGPEGHEAANYFDLWLLQK